MSKVLWLDDDAGKMESIVEGIIIQLWKRNIKSNVVLWGNGYIDDETSPDNSDSLKSLNELILDCYLDFCYEKSSSMYDNPFESYRDYINVPTDIKKSDIQTANIAEKLNFKKDEDILNFWGSDNIERKKIQTLENRTKPLIEELNNLVDDDDILALDMCLLKNEMDRIINGNKIPLVSMVIYHMMKEKGINCILFTTYYYPERSIANYQAKYKAMYNEEVDVLDRRKLKPSNLNFGSTINRFVKT